MVLARDALAEIDYPPFDRAVMDGFAVRASGASAHPMQFRAVGLARAGASDSLGLTDGTCVPINTGASIPRGADAVVALENARIDEQNFVTFDEVPTVGQHIERRASLARKGELLVRAGVRIGGGTLAALTAGGVAGVACFARPRVAILCTGDELVDIGRELQPGQLYDSNGVMIDELVRRSGAGTAWRGRCPDEPGPLRASLELGLSHDVLCVTGGMSKGTHDLVPSLLEQLGVRWLVTSLNLKPGKPMRLGRSPSGGWVFGLPGNPVSCAVCFHLFVRPVLRGLQGLGAYPPDRLSGIVLSDLPANAARPMFQPADWIAGPGGEACITPLAWRGSGDPFGMAVANALLYRESHAAESPRGDRVPFIPLDRIE